MRSATLRTFFRDRSSQTKDKDQSGYACTNLRPLLKPRTRKPRPRQASRKGSWITATRPNRARPESLRRVCGKFHGSIKAPRGTTLGPAPPRRKGLLRSPSKPNDENPAPLSSAILLCVLPRGKAQHISRLEDLLAVARTSTALVDIVGVHRRNSPFNESLIGQDGR